jgi:hypothetical protein
LWWNIWNWLLLLGIFRLSLIYLSDASVTDELRLLHNWYMPFGKRNLPMK